MAYPRAARSLVHERDIADVVVEVLQNPNTAGNAYAVTGPDVLTQREQAETIGNVVGRKVRVREVSPRAASRELEPIMGPAAAARSLQHWATLVDHPERATHDVELVTGRPARGYAQWVTDHRADFLK